MVSMPFILSDVLGGPIWAAVATVYVTVIAMALYVAVDALRPKRQKRFAEILEPRILYVASSFIFLLFVVGVWLPTVARDWSLMPVAFTPLEFAIGTAYLLRVVFPAPPADGHEADSESDSAVATAMGSGPVPASSDAHHEDDISTRDDAL